MTVIGDRIGAVRGYSILQIGLHWLIAALVLVQLMFGESMAEFLEAAEEGKPVSALDANLAGVHYYFGIAILALVAARLVLRVGRGAPPAPEANRTLELAGRISHWLFYALLVVAPVTGLLGYYFGDPYGEVHELAKPVETAVVRLGREIFTKTQVLRGTFVGNDLTCSNCHMNAGADPMAAPVWATAVDFPIYRGKEKRVNTLPDRLAGCFKYSMNGTPPPAQHEVMVALESYMRWLATGAPSGAVQKARGYVALPMPAQTPAYSRGETVYAERCATCHGVDGAGLKQGERVVFPPVWGPNSYNWGAGLHEIEKASGFLKANMTLGNPDLTEQEAWDVALYINGHERPQDPRWLVD